MKFTTIERNDLSDIGQLESRLGGRIIQARIGGELAHVAFVPTASLDWFVKMIDGQGKVSTGDSALDMMLDRKSDRAIHEELVQLVVVSGNKGQLEHSDRYSPCSAKAQKMFSDLLDSVRKA